MTSPEDFEVDMMTAPEDFEVDMMASPEGFEVDMMTAPSGSPLKNAIGKSGNLITKCTEDQLTAKGKKITITDSDVVVELCVDHKRNEMRTPFPSGCLLAELQV